MFKDKYSFFDFEDEVTPYIALGVDKDNNSYNSPLHPFFSNGKTMP